MLFLKYQLDVPALITRLVYLRDHPDCVPEFMLTDIETVMARPVNILRVSFRFYDVVASDDVCQRFYDVVGYCLRCYASRNAKFRTDSFELDLEVYLTSYPYTRRAQVFYDDEIELNPTQHMLHRFTCVHHDMPPLVAAPEVS